MFYLFIFIACSNNGLYESTLVSRDSSKLIAFERDVIGKKAFIESLQLECRVVNSTLGYKPNG